MNLNQFCDENDLQWYFMDTGCVAVLFDDKAPVGLWNLDDYSVSSNCGSYVILTPTIPADFDCDQFFDLQGLAEDLECRLLLDGCRYNLLNDVTGTLDVFRTLEKVEAALVSIENGENYLADELT